MTEIKIAVESATQAARSFVKAITATASYQAFEQAQNRLNTDEEACKMLNALEAAEQRARLSSSWGGLPKRENQKLELLREETYKQPTILAFIEAQNELIEELRELNQYMTENLGFDFADMTKPQTGCCG